MMDFIGIKIRLIPDVDVVSIEGDIVLEKVRGCRWTQLETKSSERSAFNFIQNE